jgi:hypothetical protein
MTQNIAFNKTGSSSEISQVDKTEYTERCTLWTENDFLEPKYATDGLTAI